jgi:hypothetical protein
MESVKNLQGCVIVIDHFDNLLCTSNPSDEYSPDNCLLADEFLNVLARQQRGFPGMKILLIADYLPTYNWLKNHRKSIISLMGHPKSHLLCKWSMTEAEAYFDAESVNEDCRDQFMQLIQDSRNQACSYSVLGYMAGSQQYDENFDEQLSRVNSQWDRIGMFVCGQDKAAVMDAMGHDSVAIDILPAYRVYSSAFTSVSVEAMAANRKKK